MSEQANIEAPVGAVAEATQSWVELDTRQSDGINVSLLWEQGSNTTNVSVIDNKTGESFRFEVPGEDAMEAFKHPFPYYASLGELAVHS